MIHDVVIQKLKIIKDDRGQVMHMLRRDSAMFEDFGEIYFSTVKEKAVKAWKLHKAMTLNLSVPRGRIRLVLFDDRPDSKTIGAIQEIETGEDDYCLIRIPPLIWNGFQGIAPGESLVANCATSPHDPGEVVRREMIDKRIPYAWAPRATT